MIKLTILSIFLLLSGFANAETKSQSDLLAKVEISNLTHSLRTACKIAELLSPGSSMKLVIGITALTMNPALNKFDLSKKSQLGFFSYIDDDKPNKNKIAYCFILSKKDEKSLPKKISYFNKKLYLKDFQQFGALSESSSFLKTFLKPPAFVKRDSDFYIELFPHQTTKLFPEYSVLIKKLIVDEWIRRKTKKNEKSVLKKEIGDNLDWFEAIIKDIYKLRLEIKVNEKELRFKFNATPTPKAQWFKANEVSQFIELLKSNLLKTNPKLKLELDFNVEGKQLMGNIVAPVKSIKQFLPNSLRSDKKGKRIKLKFK